MIKVLENCITSPRTLGDALNGLMAQLWVAFIRFRTTDLVWMPLFQTYTYTVIKQELILLAFPSQG